MILFLSLWRQTERMDPTDIIKKYYPEGSESYRILLDHSNSVANKALAIAEDHPEMNLDREFLYEASMLHDIGIFRTSAPEIYCFGPYPYICHGYLGSELMKKEGFPRHALVCERHTGTGLSMEEIIRNDLPLPHRDMTPQSREEELICFADKFFSKTKPGREKPVEKIKKSLSKYGEEPVRKFESWSKLFLG